MAKIKWGVLGSGGIAKRRTIPEGIIPANNAQLVAVFDVNQKINSEVASQFGAVGVASEADLLTAGIDAVYIATPAYLHRQQVLACIEAGKHVLCEKPLGMTNDEAKEMITTAQSAGVKLSTAFMMRYQSQHQEALKMIRDGKLGKCVYARAQLSCWYPPIDGAWRQNLSQGGGGSLIDMGCHCIDLLEMFLGRVKKVSCFTNNSVHDYQTEDSAVAMLTFENGTIATVDTFFCIPDNSSKNVLEIYGSKGSILAKGTLGQGQAGEMTAYLEDDSAGYDAKQSRSSNAGIKITPTPVNMYLAEIEDFCNDVLEGKITSNDEDSGLRSQIVLSACYESARTGNSVEV